jgi:hypothetical protein
LTTERGFVLLAATWNGDSAVYLVQDYERKSSFVGVSPHASDPAVRYGSVALLSQDGGRRGLAGYEDGWTVDFAMTRPLNRGFVLGVSRPPQAGVDESRCVLVSVDAVTMPCGIPTPISSDRLLAGEADLILFREVPSQRILVFDVNARTVRESTDAFLKLPWTDAPPCNMGFASLSPDLRHWVVACRREGTTGLWLVTRDGRVQLLTTAAGDEFRLPSQAIDQVRVQRSEVYSLSWSPDAEFVYYCDGVRDAAVLVEMKTEQSRGASPCLSFGSVKNSPLRINGVTETGNVMAVPVTSSGKN